MDNVTVPENPFTPEIVMVEVPRLLAKSEREVGLAVIVKSTTFMVTSAVWVSDPLAPVTVTVYVPAAVALTVSVAVPGGVTLAGVIPAVRPFEAAALSRTVRANPLAGDMVKVKAPSWPESTVMVEGLPIIAKSMTVTVTVTV